MRGDSSKHLVRAAPLAVLVLLPIALFFPAFLGGRFFALDFHLTFEPLRGILGRSLLDGVPVWNPWLGNGTPLLANPMNAALYPPNLVFMFVDAAAGLTWLAILHLIFGALGTYRLARELGTGRLGATTAGVVFAFNGPALSAISYCNLSWTLAWLPWLLFATERLLQREARVRRVVVFGLILATLLILGDPFILAAGALGVGLLAASRVLGAEFTQRPRRMRALLLGVATSLVLAGPFLWVVSRYLPASVRGTGFTAEGTTLWSLHPLLLVNLFLPDAFGDAGAWGVHRFWAVSLFPQKDAPLLIGFFVGAVGLALAVAGACRKAPLRWVLVCWFGVLLALALGRYGPVYPLLGEFPGFSALRYPMKWIVPAMLPLALLVGRALDDVTDAVLPRVKPLILATLLVAGLVSMTAVAARPPFDGWMSRVAAAGGQELEAHRSRLLLAGLHACLPLAASLAALLALRGKPRVLALTLAALLGADLLWENRKLAPLVPASFYATPPPVVQAIRADAAHQRIFVDSIPSDVRRTEAVRTHAELARWQREMLLGYVAASYGLPLAFNDDTEGFAPVRYAALSVLARSAPLRERLMILGSAGASHLVTYDALDTPYLDPFATLASSTDRPQRVYRNRLVLPRARIVGGLLPYDGDRGYIAAVQSGPPDLFARVALVERSEMGGIVPGSEEALVAGTAEITEERGAHLRIVTRGAGGFLVVSDTWVPGWNAAIDGQATALLRADYAFRAVRVPAGEHVVTMTYRAW